MVYTFDFEICLIHSLGIICWLEMFSDFSAENRRIFLNPTHNYSMRHIQSSFQDHIFEISVGERILKFQSDTENDDI